MNLKLIVRQVHEKTASGDYAEFEAMRSSLIAWLEEPPAPPQRIPPPARNVTPPARHAIADLIRLMGILAS